MGDLALVLAGVAVISRFSPGHANCGWPEGRRKESSPGNFIEAALDALFFATVGRDFASEP
jgi:hypothetical protein